MSDIPRYTEDRLTQSDGAINGDARSKKEWEKNVVKQSACCVVS